MKYLIVLIVMLCTVQLVSSQKYFSKTGKIAFHSDAPMEKIEATNTTASTVLDASTGNYEWAVLIQGFKFDKSLMQEHFNENYMESGTYPKAKFKGKVDNISSVNFKKDGDYPVNVSGQMEIHGVTKPVSSTGVITVKGGSISAKSDMTILIADYGIVIPKLVADNIAKTVDIKVQADYQMMPAN
ncbi:MAG: YceI family protein [Bacteroidota bacterium]|nr:YceI family protein [Bacteroidota bacterium]